MISKHFFSYMLLITSSFMYSRPISISNLPFENNDITIEKVMAGGVLLFVYFIPTIISWDKKKGKYVFVFNLLTAWTVLGWFISFVLALKVSRESKLAESEMKKKKKKTKKATLANIK
jgi:hypothetical protein